MPDSRFPVAYHRFFRRCRAVGARLWIRSSKARNLAGAPVDAATVANPPADRGSGAGTHPVTPAYLGPVVNSRASIATAEVSQTETYDMTRPDCVERRMNEQLMGHDDGVTQGGVRRLRRPPDWEQGVGRDAVTTIAWLLPDVTPAIGDDCDIDGMRYRVLDSTWLAKTPHAGMLVDARGRAIQLELDPIGDSPEDPLMPWARAIIERHTARSNSLARSGTAPGATLRSRQGDLAGPHDRRVAGRARTPPRPAGRARPVAQHSQLGHTISQEPLPARDGVSDGAPEMRL